jgi:predicted urease superfamily metal-dependent hydrolase
MGGAPNQYCRRAEGEKLPAVSAIPTVASITAAASTSATAITSISSATAPPSPAVSSATASSARTFCLRTGFVDDQVPATKVLTVQAVDRAVRIFIASYFDEREPARLPGKTITDQTDC